LEEPDFGTVDAEISIRRAVGYKEKDYNGRELGREDGEKNRE
jgi:hypothetical protein